MYLAEPGIEATVPQHVRVVVADDHPVVRAGIVQGLLRHPAIEVLAEAANGDHALELAQTLNPDVMLLDISMPGPPAALLVQSMTVLPSPPHVVILTAHMDIEHILAVFKAGAVGYVLKDEELKMLVGAVLAVAQGETWMSAAVTTQLLSYAVNHQATAFPRLSPREGDVFHHLTNGKPNRAISQLLNMSERTVRFHVQNIYDKLGVRRRSEAIALGMQQRLEVKRGSDCER